MMTKFRSCRTAVSDAEIRVDLHEAPWKTQAKLVREKLLQDSLTMFRDLGLTPREMSRISGFTPVAIEEGLKRRDIVDGIIVGPGLAHRASIEHMGSKRLQTTHLKRVLLAEDDTVVAADLAWELEAVGMVVVGIVSSLHEALEWINGRKIDFALLNIVLQDGVSFPAARQLKALGIPYAFFSGLEKDEIGSEFLDVPHLSKPQCSKAVARSVSDLVRSLPPMPVPSMERFTRHSLPKIGFGQNGQPNHCQ